MNLCKYQNKEITPKYICRQKAEQNGVCFFHMDRPYLDLKANIPVEEAKRQTQESKEFYERILSYMSTITDDTYRFVGFIFPSIDWRKPIFDRNVDFRYAKFPQGISFGNDVVFNGTAIFDNAEFNGALFYTNVFKKYAYFQNTVFYGLGGHFNGANFEKDVYFNGAKFFNKFFTFSGSVFKEKAYFGSVKFDKPNEKINTLIEKEQKPAIDFSHTTFEDFCEFSNCEFLIDALFNSSKFKKGFSIYKTNFHQEANFNNAEFSIETKIWASCFSQKSHFDSAKLSGEISFIGDKNRCFKKSVDFQRLKLSKDTILIFDKANLSRASFLYTNLENLTFWDVDWFKGQQKRFFMPNRPQLWDEERLDSSDELYERVADNYRQLVNNYEKKRDFKTAEYFHIGEMEIRRKKHKHNSSIGIKNKWWRWFRGGFNTTGFYWLSSRYGTSYTQGIFILLILTLLIIPIIFLLTGFQTSKEINSEFHRVIDFTLLPNSTNEFASIAQIWNGYLDAISYTFSIITFQKDRFYTPLDNSWWSQMALYLAMVLLTTQAALTLLAVRRQFKR